MREKETERVPSYRKHSSGQARVTIRGRDILLGPWGSSESRKEYARIIAEWLASGRSPTFGTPVNDLTISQLIADYLVYAKSYYRQTAGLEIDNMRPALRVWRQLYGSTLVVEFDTKRYKAVRDHLCKEGDRSRRYVNILCQKITRVLKWGVAEGRIPAEVANAIAMVPGLKRNRTELRETEPVTPVPEELYQATLPHLNSVVRDMVKFQRAVGCRPGEICKITPGMVKQEGDIWEIHLDKHKSAWRGKSRIIYVGKDAQEILAKYLQRPADMHCFAPREARKNRAFEIKKKPGVLTARIKGKGSRPAFKFTTSTYRQAVTRGCEKAFPAPKNLKSKAEIAKWRSEHLWSPNQLRHSFATHIRKVAGIEAAKALLGHSDLTTTQIYAEVDRNAAVEALRRLSK